MLTVNSMDGCSTASSAETREAARAAAATESATVRMLLIAKSLDGDEDVRRGMKVGEGKDAAVVARAETVQLKYVGQCAVPRIPAGFSHASSSFTRQCFRYFSAFTHTKGTSQ